MLIVQFSTKLFTILGDQREMETEDASVTENVPRSKHSHEKIHHGCPEGEGESGPDQNHQICWSSSKRSLFGCYRGGGILAAIAIRFQSKESNHIQQKAKDRLSYSFK